MVITLKTKRLILKEPSIEDIDIIIAYLIKNKQAMKDFSPIRPPEYYSESYWQEKISSRENLDFYDKDCQLFLYLKDNDSIAIGYINFSNIILGAFQSCTLGYELDPDFQGQGFMHEALLSGIDYCFKEKNLHRIQANHIESNEKSANVLKKLGFEIEGKAKDYLYINGRWQDHILTSLINNNWQNNNS